MSITLLLEKYDVSTEEGLRKALEEIENEESEVDEALTGVLNRATALEGRLHTASQAYTKLGEVRNDGQAAAEMVDRTAALARDVSAKVRQLDLARSRVAECQRRVHDLIDLQLCSEGVEAAIKAHDYETGAAHVARYLSMDPGSVAAAQARGAPDPRDAMAKAAETLREHLIRKFEEAARKEDEVAIERLFKLFPQLGRADEGVDLLAKYLATQAESTIRRVIKVPDISSDTAVFADAFTRLLETGGAAVEKARLAASVCAPGRLTRSIRIIQPAICAGARRLYGSLVAARRLSELCAPRARAAPPPSPLAVEPVLAELALVLSRHSLYFAFLGRKTAADASSLDEAGRQQCMEAVEKIISECELQRTVQDLLGHYLELERYFLEESVNKALKFAAPQPGATSSSLVDDVFFIAKKVICRSLSTGIVDGACAVINDVSALLERDVAACLRRFVRGGPAEPLALPPPGGVCDVIGRDADVARQLFLAHMSEAEAGAEWSERLATDACMEAEPLFRSASERDKFHSCASGLATAAAAFRSAHELALAGLRAALNARVNAWAEAVVVPHVDPDEMEDDADALPAALESLSESARAVLSARTSDALLLSVVSDIAARAEPRILHYTYDREGGLCVERRARRLAAWAGSSAAGARERCARLAQAAALLALERVAHAPDALQPTARLPPALVKDVLARRSDFKIEDIKRLKL